MERFTIKHLTFCYPGQEIPAVKNISLTIHAGDFLVLCGHSGCGKTTLLRCFKPQLAPHGERTGEVCFDGVPLHELDERQSSAEIGFVQQSPENQIVTDKVWHELAFGLESLGYDTPTIRRRVAETASFFGIQNWFHKQVSELSGGQKQLLNLASVMVMQPKVLILDEPTSQLDPIAASDFLAVLKKINLELGTTILLTEHRLEEALPLSNRTAVMENGQLLFCGSPAETGVFLKEHGHNLFLGMPAAMQIWGSVDSAEPCPVSVKEGREFLAEYTKTIKAAPLERKAHEFGKERIALHGAWFRYAKEFPDVVRNVNLSARAGELLCILGGNGTGKTTTLKLLAGLKKPYRGEVYSNGTVCFLPQEPRTLFVKHTVYKELEDSLFGSGLPKEQYRLKIAEVLHLCRLEGLENRHPYDLSGGEQQRAALAKLLLLHPEILLLDEPTKGLDAECKADFGRLIRKLLHTGVCIVMVSHDIAFCAEYADRCALFFDGSIATEGEPHEFFSGNSFYTTAAHRISRGIIPDTVTTQDVITAIGGRIPDTNQSFSSDHTKSDNTVYPVSSIPKIPLWRKIGASASGILSLMIYFYTIQTENFSEMLGQNGLTPIGTKQLGMYGLLILSLLLTAIFLGKGTTRHIAAEPSVPTNRKLPKRTIAAVILMVFLIPVTLYIGTILDQKQYYLIALTVLTECMLPFFLVLEGRKPKARELVIISVLCALAVAGRAAFFMLPQFKPVLAIVIIAGAAFGGETGFLVGAVTMLVSNIMFSQGPWTPWQMFAAGIIGFLAGVLCRKGLLRKTRMSLSVFGAASAILLYGGIMNPVSALIWGNETLHFNMILGYYLTGLPMDCVHAAATAIFLWFLSEPMLEKLERIKIKYGLIE